MPKPLQFSNFRVVGLRGNVTIDARIKDNTLILVGENGSGKTTFLRVMFYFLSAKWSNLAQLDFNEIVATINGTDYVITKKELLAISIPMDDRSLRAIPPSQRRRIQDFIAMGRIVEAEAMYRNYSNHYPGLLSDLSSDERRTVATNTAERMSELHDAVQQSLGAQILYLPTFRRIERELSSILQGFEGAEDSRRPPQVVRQSEDANDYVELVEFGMNDVKKAITSTLEEVRSFQLDGITRLSLSYLGDVVSQKYKTTDRSVISDASNETIEAVLNRIDHTILSDYNKEQLREIILATKTTANVPSEHQQIIYHYFTKLVSFQAQLQSKEKNISLFCELCSTYIVDKVFIYESAKFSFSIKSRFGKQTEIELSELSSGEKQIVSLFSHLYLSGRDKFFVLIDEPELSLSVPWQRRFLLDIQKASFCAGLVAVTHSPFIYDNELRKNTHAIGEFVVGPDWGNLS